MIEVIKLAYFANVSLRLTLKEQLAEGQIVNIFITHGRTI